MPEFPEGHARLVALEWLVRRLAIVQCLKTAAPVLEADGIRSDAEAHSVALLGSPKNPAMIINV